MLWEREVECQPSEYLRKCSSQQRGTHLCSFLLCFMFALFCELFCIGGPLVLQIFKSLLVYWITKKWTKNMCTARRSFIMSQTWPAPWKPPHASSLPVSPVTTFGYPRFCLLSPKPWCPILILNFIWMESCWMSSWRSDFWNIMFVTVTHAVVCSWGLGNWTVILDLTKLIYRNTFVHYSVDASCFGARMINVAIRILVYVSFTKYTCVFQFLLVIITVCSYIWKLLEFAFLDGR